MSLEALSLIAVALISPGPDFTVVTRLAIVSGRRTGLWGAAGVIVAIGVYVLVPAALPGLGRRLRVADTKNEANFACSP